MMINISFNESSESNYTCSCNIYFHFHIFLLARKLVFSTYRTERILFQKERQYFHVFLSFEIIICHNKLSANKLFQSHTTLNLWMCVNDFCCSRCRRRLSLLYSCIHSVFLRNRVMQIRKYFYENWTRERESGSHLCTFSIGI